MKQLNNTIKTYLNRKQKAIGIEVLQQDGQWLFNVVELHQQKDTVNIGQKHTLLEGFEHLCSKLDTSIPVFLTLNIRGILTKRTTNMTGTEQEKLQEVLPNSNLSSFYYQVTPTISGEYISIIRKDNVDTILEQFKEARLTVLSLSLSSFNVVNILPLLQESDVVQTTLHQLEYEENNLIQFHNNAEILYNETVLLGRNWLSTLLTVPFASAFNGLINPIPTTISIPNILDNQSEYFQKRLFQVGGLFILSFFLIVLSVNYYLFTQYYQDNQELSVAAAVKEQQLQELKTLQQKITEQQGLTNLLTSRTSFYADRIAATLPASIDLFEMSFFPSTQSDFYNEKATFEYEKNTIIIKGNCKRSTTYNKWLKKIARLDWVLSVQNVNYQDIEDNYSEFEVRVMLK